MKLTFNEDVFDKNYAWLLSFGRRLLMPGFVLFVIAVLSSITFGYSLQIPDPYRTGIAVYSLICFIGFPILTLYRLGERKRLKNSELFLRQDGSMIYDQQNEKLFTVAGIAEERFLFIIHPGYTYRRTKSWYVIEGEIERQKKYLGKTDANTWVRRVRIPIVFIGMERIEKSAH